MIYCVGISLFLFRLKIIRLNSVFRFSCDWVDLNRDLFPQYFSNPIELAIPPLVEFRIQFLFMVPVWIPTYLLCLSSDFLVITKYITYNQLKIPCKNANRTDLFLSQETTTANTLPNPIPLVIAVFLIPLFPEFWLKHSKDNMSIKTKDNFILFIFEILRFWGFEGVLSMDANSLIYEL